jgi:hypothetical protein
MISGVLKGMVENDDRYEAAKRNALQLLKRGIRPGGKITWKREDLYDRQNVRGVFKKPLQHSQRGSGLWSADRRNHHFKSPPTKGITSRWRARVMPT